MPELPELMTATQSLRVACTRIKRNQCSMSQGHQTALEHAYSLVKQWQTTGNAALPLCTAHGSITACLYDVKQRRVTLDPITHRYLIDAQTILAQYI